MKNPLTLTNHRGGTFETDAEIYQSIVDVVETWLATLSPALQATARPFWEKLAPGEFSRVAALLPHWFSDLLPVSSETARKLGLAHLYGWWYYYVQDELLDGDAAGSDLLGGHLALLKMLEIYDALKLTGALCWQDFQRLTRLSAETYALEMTTRFTNLTDLTPEQLALWTVDFIINRAAPFYFNSIAHIHLSGLAADAPLRGDLLAALQAFTAVRQIADDAGDWVEDLQRGRLNYVSARLLQRFLARGLTANAADCDIDRLIGYQLTDEPFWEDIAQTSQDLCQNALDRLAPYGNCRLADLIRRQTAQNAAHWAEAKKQRANLRAIFGT